MSTAVDESPGDTQFTPNQPPPDRPVAPAPRLPDTKKLEQLDLEKERAQTQAQERTLEEQLVANTAERHRTDAKYQALSRPLLQNVIDAHTELNRDPNVQPDPRIQAEIEQYKQMQSKPNPAMDIVKLALAGVAVGVIAFGMRRGWGAQAGVMMGIGNALKAYSQGKKDYAQEQLDNVYRIQQLIQEENAERHRQMSEIYQNRSLALREKVAAFSAAEKAYGMDVAQNKLGDTEWNQQLRLLANHEQALNRFQQLKIQTHNHLTNFMTQTAPGKEYRTYIMMESAKPDSWTHGRQIDPDRSPEELNEALAHYDYSQFLQDRKNLGKVNLETGKEGTMGPPSEKGEGLKGAMKNFFESRKSTFPAGPPSSEDSSSE